MINKIKENNTLYIRKCKCCNSLFSYNMHDYANSYGYGNTFGSVECPYCKYENKIKFRIRYKSSKKVVQDYKAELEQLNKELLNLKKEYKDFKDGVGELKYYESLYNSQKRDIEKLRGDYNNEHSKVRKVNNYINDYLNSDRKNNLAIKYLKEIQELIK